MDNLAQIQLQCNVYVNFMQSLQSSLELLSLMNYQNQIYQQLITAFY